MYTLSELSKYLGINFSGDANAQVSGLSSLSSPQPNSIVFLEKAINFSDLKEKKCILLCDPDLLLCNDVSALLSKTPRLDFIKLFPLFYPVVKEAPGIHATAVVSVDAVVDPSATIGPYAVIGDGAEIGAHTVIDSHVSLGRYVKIGKSCKIHSHSVLYDHVTLGNETIIHAGAVLGADGFGYVPDLSGKLVKTPHIGSVLIGNDVEIGANATIDRAAMDETIINDGVKIDNLVMIAHNVTIGKHTVIAGCAGIAGSTHVGAYSMIGGAVSIADHVTLCDKIQIAGASSVHKSIETPGAYGSAIPVLPIAIWRKNVIRYSKLDILYKRVKKVETLLESSDEH